MRLRTLLPFAVAASLGAAVVVLPALAASSEAKLEVNENCNYPNWPCWTSSPGPNPPPASVTTIAAGGVVTFLDSTSVAASLAWTGAAPTCSPSVPVSPTPAKAGWEGTCKFEQPGRYKLESATLYQSYRSYEVVVQAPSTTGTTPTGSTIGSTSGGSTSSGSGSTSSGSGSPTQAGGPAATGTPVGSLLAGSASSAVKLAPGRDGRSVHGSVEVSRAGAGGRLEVRLLATRASLASAGHGSRVQVGRAVIAPLSAGTVGFTVGLDARARLALRKHGRLALSVRVLLTHAHAQAVTIVRGIVIRR
jgi:hypothetical protein